MKHVLSKGLVLIVFLGSSLIGFSQNKNNPCPDRFGKDSVKAMEQLSLFNQYLKSKEYVKAYPYWVYLFENAPCAQKHVTFNGALIAKKYLKHLKTTSDSVYKLRKAGLVDTILLTYPKRIELWGKEGYVKGKWAGDWANLKPKERQQALKLFEESVKMEGNKTTYRVPMNYMKTAVKEHKKKAYSLDSLYNLYFQLMDITDYNLKNSKKKLEQWKATEAYLNKLMKPYLNCEKVEEYFKPKVDEAPNDTALLRKVADLLNAADCQKSGFFLGIAEKLYELDPSPASAKIIAVGRHANKDYQNAVKWYEKAVEGEVDSSKADMYLTIATIYSSKLKNISKANKAASSALELNDKLAKAYLVKAEFYASQEGACGADKIDGKSVFWAAADACIKARGYTADEDVLKAINQRLAYYRNRFIEKEEAFFKGFTLTEGSSFTVPCLGIVTTVRFKK